MSDPNPVRRHFGTFRKYLFRTLGIGVVGLCILIAAHSWVPPSASISMTPQGEGVVIDIDSNFRVRHLMRAEFSDAETGAMLWKITFDRPFAKKHAFLSTELPDAVKQDFPPAGRSPDLLHKRLKVIIHVQYDTTIPPAACSTMILREITLP